MSNSSERLGQKQHPGLLSFGIFLAIIGPVVSALLLAWLCRLAGWEHRSAVFWIAMAPVLYLAWLFLLLGFYVAETSLLALFYTKPRRYHEQEPGSTRTAFLISLTLYGRAFFIGSLPFVPLFICLPGFRWLVLRAYSTRTFLGEGCLLAGYIGDPDLTIIGARVVVGAYTRLIAHSITRTPDGFAVYQTAPIELGPDCTIGGNTLVEMGVKIGAGSIIEQASHLVPFTIVPPGEVWGGAPAAFRRKREAGARQVESPPSAVIPAVTSGAETQEILALIPAGWNGDERHVQPELPGVGFAGQNVHCRGVARPVWIEPVGGDDFRAGFRRRCGTGIGREPGKCAGARGGVFRAVKSRVVAIAGPGERRRRPGTKTWEWKPGFRHPLENTNRGGLDLRGPTTGFDAAVIQPGIWD
jgi:hypothetical protein